MANTIALRKQYSTMLDEVYKLASLTTVLDGPSELIRDGANANEILIPKISMDGLANYSRTTGFSDGSITWEYETKQIAYDRGRMFTVDARDVSEAMQQFGIAGAQFIRTKVIPELDAYRFAAYAAKAGTKVAAALSTGDAAVKAVSVAKTAIKNAEGDVSNAILFITPAVKALIDDLDTTKSRAALEGWAQIIEVPTARFADAVTLGANGYTLSGKALNFLAVKKDAVVQFQNHTVNKVITPEQNQSADAWKFGYRTAGIAEVEDNKAVGIYAHTVTA